jgi:dTDP-4-dehydrorhamnose 3,5-epimerase
MRVTRLALPEVRLLTPEVHEDERGFFMESWNAADFARAIGVDVEFVQDNHSRSSRGVLRGLHYQLPPNVQGKLVRVVTGAAFDVAVDIRGSSSTYGQWVGVHLSEDNKSQLWVPAGFAHGVLALTPVVDVLYKVTAPYDRVSDRSIRWDDPQVGIDWPLEIPAVLSEKDRTAPLLADADVFD